VIERNISISLILPIVLVVGCAGVRSQPDVMEKEKLLINSSFTFPMGFHGQEIDGFVLLGFSLSAEGGIPNRIEVLDSDLPEPFYNSAIDWLKGARYSPRKINGMGVSVEKLSSQP